MAEVQFSHGAERQYRAIIDDRGDFAGVSAQRRLAEAFARLRALLGDFPHVGALIHTTAGCEFRQFPVDGFVVRFRVTVNTGDVLIVDVRSGARRAPTLSQLESEADRFGEEAQ
jgi:plasmid stabilization system protein ParE